jgi:hypothetical protein
MTEQTGTKQAETDEQRIASHAWKRRGLIAAAWAAVAAIVARQTTEPVEAGVDGDVVLGANNTTIATTFITNTNSAGGAALGLVSTAGNNGVACARRAAVSAFSDRAAEEWQVARGLSALRPGRTTTA